MQLGIRSMMCAPLIGSKDQVLGMLQVDTLDQRAHFQQADLDLLATVAAQAAMAVEIVNLHRAAVRQEVVERDLALAHRVQQGLLPPGPPRIEGYDFFDFYQPADQVGGDYYDYVKLPDGRLAVIVADVAGKGVAAALLMAKISAEARYALATHRDPAEAVGVLNQNFSREGWDDRFVTMVLVVLDPAAHAATIVNAGHMPPYLRRAAGHVEPAGDRERGRPLGIEADSQYEAVSIKLAPGDWLVMFTDGISEAMNAQGNIYSLPRVQAAVAVPAASVSELGQQLLADVERFAGTQPRGDDVCLVCFGRVRA
jgi:serine phosphatase RsbU (regulator of sigma subunit)